jgi:putative transposase
MAQRKSSFKMLHDGCGSGYCFVVSYEQHS